MDYKTSVETPPTRLFFKAALPGSVGMLASSVYQLIDGMLVGQILGSTAFAALNLAMPFVIHQLCPGGSHRSGILRFHFHPAGRKE